MRHHHKPFKLDRNAAKQCKREFINNALSGNLFAGDLTKAMEDSQTQNAFDDPEGYQQAIESHAASYAKLCEFVDKHNLRSGGDLALDVAIDAIAKVHNIDMRSDEEKLVDDVKQLIDDARGLDSKILAGVLCDKYNITKKD